MAKKKVKKSVLHQDVHHIWGWVVMTVGIFMILAIAAYYYLSVCAV